ISDADPTQAGSGLDGVDAAIRYTTSSKTPIRMSSTSSHPRDRLGKRRIAAAALAPPDITGSRCPPIHAVSGPVLAPRTAPAPARLTSTTHPRRRTAHG